MTKDKDLKQLARERAEKTGESYSTARRQLEAKRLDQPDHRLTNDGALPPMGAGPMATAPLARDEARIAGHPWVEPEHLLLGLLSHGDVLPTLHAMRVSPVALRHHTERVLPPKRDAIVTPTLSATFLWAQSLGREEARCRDADDTSSHDLLLALTLLDRPVSTVLREFGAGEDRLRAHLAYREPPLENRVRAVVANRLLTLLGQSTTRVEHLVRAVQITTEGTRVSVMITSEDALVLARFADDIRAAAEPLLDSAEVMINIAATA